ncbi:RHS repeat-associated core domain-containing protein [Streptomyces sp. NPDC093984]|uniref:RHS repeat-associated core domain-containing protein n=1 Tax=Streptomyces sp. NPDC093984 TaxID=3366052 RepID=UPI0038075E54
MAASGTQDDNTGLTNLGAREYDPSIGRFLSPDPILDTGAPQSWNAYDYADDTPVTTSDPTGACADVDCPTRNCPYCINYTPGDREGIKRSINDHPGSGSTPNNTEGTVTLVDRWDDLLVDQAGRGRSWGARRCRTRGTGTRSRSSPTACGCTTASRCPSARSRSSCSSAA